MSTQQQEINKFIKSFEKNISISLKATETATNSSLFDLYKMLIDRTVVGNPKLWKYPAPRDYKPGKLKSSWNISFTGMRAGTGQFTSAQSIASNHGFALNISNLNTVKIAYIWNPQPYMERIEYGSWSTQAPKGFVRLTLLEFNQIFERQVARNKVK